MLSQGGCTNDYLSISCHGGCELMSPTHVSELQDFAPLTGEELGLPRLDLACGKFKLEGYTGVDIIQLPGVDVVYDLNVYPYPFEESSIYQIYCSHFVEHVKDLKLFMEECWRILMPGARFTIVAPYYTSIRAIQDYTHVRSICETTFQYFSQEWLKAMGLEHYDVKCDFATDSLTYKFDPKWATRGDEAREWARMHYNNVVMDIETMLRTIKK